MEDPRKGPKVDSLGQLYKVARDRRSVIYGRCDTVQPAAFVLFFQGARLVRIFDDGMYIYVPQRDRLTARSAPWKNTCEKCAKKCTWACPYDDQTARLCSKFEKIADEEM